MHFDGRGCTRKFPARHPRYSASASELPTCATSALFFALCFCSSPPLCSVPAPLASAPRPVRPISASPLRSRHIRPSNCQHGRLLQHPRPPGRLPISGHCHSVDPVRRCLPGRLGRQQEGRRDPAHQRGFAGRGGVCQEVHRGRREEEGGGTLEKSVKTGVSTCIQAGADYFVPIMQHICAVYILVTK